MRSFILAVFTFMVVLCYGQANDEGFVLVKSDPPFEIHERWIQFPGRDFTSRELKSEFTVRATIDEIVAFLKDETQVTEWQAHVSKYKIYQKEDSNYWEEYARHDVPWPVSDQDTFLEYELTKVTEGELLISFKSIVDYTVAPVYKDVNRVELIGSWKLEQVSTDAVKVTYRIQSTPFTTLPRMVVDPFIRSNLLASLRSMSELIEK